MSGGEQQMLALAKCFVMEPKLLLIDELSLGLAPKIVDELLGTVRRLNAEGVAVLLVDQHVDLALDVASRAYFIERGEIRFSGPAEDLRGRDDLLRSVFLTGAMAQA
jgi:branched-chain amino acid transport system ATP-binding protein